MKKFISIAALTSCCLFGLWFVSSSGAFETAKAADDQDKTQPSSIPNYVKATFQQMVGEWSDEEQMLTLTMRWSPDGKTLIWHWKGAEPIVGKQNSGTGVIGWDGAKKRGVEFGIFGDGSTFTATFLFPKGKVSKSFHSPCQQSRIVDGKIVLGEMLRTWIVKSKDEFHVNFTRHFEDGQYVPDSVQVFKRNQK